MSLATCNRLQIPRSAFSITAAAASGAQTVYVSRRRDVHKLDSPTREACHTEYEDMFKLRPGTDRELSKACREHGMSMA